MRAFICRKYGTPDVLQLEEIKKPVPKENEVLIKIHATSINAADLEYLKGIFLVRLGGLFEPKYRILGTDVAGTIEAAGHKVQKFRPGDKVYGDTSEYGFGAFAEYVAVPENAITIKPDNMPFEEAATIPQAGVIHLVN